MNQNTQFKINKDMKQQQLKGRELKVYNFLKDAKKQYETSGKVFKGVYKNHNIGKVPKDILFSVIKKNGEITRADVANYIKRAYQYRKQKNDKLKKHNVLSFVKGIFQSIGDKISTTKGKKTRGRIDTQEKEQKTRPELEPEIHREFNEQQEWVHRFFKKADRLNTKFNLGDNVFFVDSPKIEKHCVTSIQIIDAINYKKPYIAYGIDNNYRQWYKEDVFCDATI